MTFVWDVKMYLMDMNCLVKHNTHVKRNVIGKLQKVSSETHVFNVDRCFLKKIV